ncbi:MAG: hypothetical protein ACOCRA_05370, partial [Halobacteria archaeon]
MLLGLAFAGVGRDEVLVVIVDAVGFVPVAIGPRPEPVALGRDRVDRDSVVVLAPRAHVEVLGGLLDGAADVVDGSVRQIPDAAHLAMLERPAAFN